MRNAKSKHGLGSAMSNSAWCDFNKTFTVLKLHYMCHNPKCNCQKQITFTPKQFQLEGNGFKNATEKNFKKSGTTWNKCFKPAVNVAAPFIGMASGAKTKSPRTAQATTIILKSISGGKILSLTDMHGNGLPLKVM